MNSAKISIIIPTHCRHNYLTRCVSWFLHWGYKIIVADSTDSRWENNLVKHADVTYVHVPGDFSKYISKVNVALSYVDTPYVAFCADDDFTLNDGLSVALDFLEANNDYSFCQGLAYFYQTIGTRVALLPFVYSANIKSEDWLERVTQSKNTTYYGLNRTHIVRDAFDFLSKQNILRNASTTGLIDLAFTAIVSRAGKLMFLSQPFCLREYSPRVLSVGSRYNLIFEQELSIFYNNLIYKLEDKEVTSQVNIIKLKRWLSNDLLGQLNYDKNASVGIRSTVSKFPRVIQEQLEFFYRVLILIRLALNKSGFRTLKIFFCEEYRLVNKILKMKT